MLIRLFKNDGFGTRKVKEFEVSSKEYEIKVPDVGFIKVKKLMPVVKIDDNYIVTKTYSVKIGNKVFRGSKYEVLRELLDKKAKNVSVKVFDTLYYDVPSDATVSIDVYDGNKLINSISYFMEEDDTLKIIIKFLSGHFVREIWFYEIINPKKKMNDN